jgi:hypothetical protein
MAVTVWPAGTTKICMARRTPTALRPIIRVVNIVRPGTMADSIQTDPINQRP